MKWHLIAAWVFLLGISLRAEPADSRRFELSDWEKIVTVTDLQVCPSGKTVVVMTKRANIDKKRYDSELLLLDIATGASRSLSANRPGLGSPRWSPSGDRMAFLADDGPQGKEKAQLFVLPMDGGEARRITEAPEGLQQFAWRPDGRAFAFVTADTSPDKERIERGEDGFEVGNDHFLTTAAPTSLHAWLVDAAGGTARRLSSGTWSIPPGLEFQAPSELSWSPDGRRIALVMQDTPHPGDSDRSRIAVLDLDSGKLNPLTGAQLGEGYPSYSPDGSHIAYQAYRDGVFWISENELCVAPSSGGKGRSVSRALEHDFTRFLWMPDSRTLLAGAAEGLLDGLWLVPLEGAARRIDLGELNTGGLGGCQVAVGPKGMIVFAASTSNRAPELYCLETPDAKPRQLTHFNDAINALSFGKVEKFDWQGPDGVKGDGLVYLPPGFTPANKYPLVLEIHGGPNMASTETFDELRLLLASQGYVVFAPNYRGSNHRGHAYQVAVINDAGEGPGRDIMAGLELLKNRGYVDERRIGLSGWSYGGFMTVWLAGHYSGWKAAIAGAPLVDWVDTTYTGDLNIQAFNNFGGLPWKGSFMKAYREQSPISRAQDIRVPTLILADTGDVRVPITQSYQLFQALKANGTEVKFIAYPCAGHWPSDPVRTRDIYRRWIEWMNQHLGTKPLIPGK